MPERFYFPQQTQLNLHSVRFIICQREVWTSGTHLLRVSIDRGDPDSNVELVLFADNEIEVSFLDPIDENQEAVAGTASEAATPTSIPEGEDDSDPIPF
jgi:hypothetical protein